MNEHRHLGTAELADLLSLTRQRVNVLRTHADFPKPVDDLACGPIWHEADVLAWVERRTPNPGGRPRKIDQP